MRMYLAFLLPITYHHWETAVSTPLASALIGEKSLQSDNYACKSFTGSKAPQPLPTLLFTLVELLTTNLGQALSIYFLLLMARHLPQGIGSY